MEQYDVTCPICGTLNKGLFLDETGGWNVSIATPWLWMANTPVSTLCGSLL